MEPQGILAAVLLWAEKPVNQGLAARGKNDFQ